MLEIMYSENELKNHFENPNYHYYLLGDEEKTLGIMGFENHYQKNHQTPQNLSFRRSQRKRIRKRCSTVFKRTGKKLWR